MKVVPIEANFGDGPWWCALDGARFEKDFLDPPAQIPDDQFRRWVDGYDRDHPYSLASEVGDEDDDDHPLGTLDRLFPLRNGLRVVDPKAGAPLLYHVCVHTCAVAVVRGRHQKSPARTLVDYTTDRALDRDGMRTLLEAAGFDYGAFREGWRLLCRTAGLELGSGGAPAQPAWLRGVAGSMCGYAGLLSPVEVEALAALDRAPPGRTLRDGIRVVKPRFHCTQDADDLELLVELASRIAGTGQWLLSVQAAT